VAPGEAVEEVFAAIAKDGYDGAMIGGSMFFNASASAPRRWPTRCRPFP
jgi:hypothetical protein